MCLKKIGTKYASKDEIELDVHKAFREVLIEVLSFGFGVAVLVLAHFSWYYSSMGSPSFTPWSTAHTNKHTIKKKK